MKAFTYVSLFSGIGGFETALNGLGGKCVMASEIDKFANKAYKLLYGMETVGDITKIKAKDVPEHNLLTAGFPCFAEGTLITTSEGLKPIEDICIGDKVLTHTNTFKSVVIPMKKFKKGLYRLKVQGSPNTLITEEHPVYAREMFRTYPTINNKRVNKRNWTEPKWVKAKDLKKGVHFIGMSKNNISNNPHGISKEDAWLIGRYIADGYIRNGRRKGRNNSYNTQVVYCVGKAKLREFKENVSSYYLGISEERTVYKVRIINKRLMNLCLEAGRGAENKKIPGFILELPTDILKIFLEGYLSGDGSKYNKNYTATSVSRTLIYGLGQIVQKLYQTPYSIQYCKRPKSTTIEGRVVNQRDTWTIRFRKENRKQQQGVYIDGMLWMPIRSLIYDETFEGGVYNLEVEEDNSYVANNLTVHNCQAFSISGKRKGFEDTRGTLFFEIARIAKEKQPKILLLENVKGLINHNEGNTFNTMIQVLCDIGYTVDYTILNSKYFDVPQNRERVFIVAIKDVFIQQEKWTSIEGNTILPRSKRRIQKLEGVKTFNFDWPEQIEVTKRLKDILEVNVDERFYLSEDKTAKLVEQLNKKGDLKQEGYIENNAQGNRIYDKEGVGATVASQTGGLGGRGVTLIEDSKCVLDTKPKDAFRVYNGVCPTLQASDYKEPKQVVEPQMVGLLNMKGNESIRRVYASTGVSPTLTTMEGGHREPKVAVTSEELPEWIPKPNEVNNTLRTGGKGSLMAKHNYDHIAEEITSEPKYRIRKLTPLECFRLQAFPDEYHEILSANGISNTQLYKMAGNAVTVSVIDAIGKKLLSYI